MHYIKPLTWHAIKYAATQFSPVNKCSCCCKDVDVALSEELNVMSSENKSNAWTHGL
jgi:hypothetical protein